MKLEDVRDTYYSLTGRASDIARQLSFAGIALIWAFRETSGGIERVPSELTPAGILVVLSLSFDLLHYVIGGAIWGIYNRRKERAGVEQAVDFEANPFLNWPSIGLYWAKILCVISAYWFFLTFLLERVV